MKDPYDYISQILRKPAWAAEIEAALWAGVQKGADDECWPWTGRRRGDYGALAVGGGWEEATHRLAFAFANGRSPFPLLVCHSCDFGLCCNPADLYLGTARERTADKMARGRHRPSPQPGEKNPRARLSADQVEAIRVRILGSIETNRAIAAEYGVSHATVSLIRRGKSWGGPALQRPYESLRVSPYAR